MTHLKAYALAILMGAGPAFAELQPEQFYFVVSTVPAPDELNAFQGPVGGNRYLSVTGALANQMSEQCQADVFVFYTNLMSDEDTPWAPDYLFAYIGGYEDRERVLEEARASSCFDDGYLKKGAAFMPERIFICATGEGLEDIQDDEYCEGY